MKPTTADVVDDTPTTDVSIPVITAQEIQESPKYKGLKILLAKIPKEKRDNITFTRDIVATLNFTLEHMTHGLTAKVAMICTGPTCIYAASCPLMPMIENILGSPCPIEDQMMMVWRQQYIDALDVNPENKVEMDRVNELVEADILDMRTSGMLSMGGLFDEQPLGIDRHGETIYRKEIGVAVNAKMLFKARKDKIIKEFMATREMRAKYRLSKNVDPSSYSANLLQEASKYAREVEESEWAPADGDDEEIEVSAPKDE